MQIKSSSLSDIAKVVITTEKLTQIKHQVIEILANSKFSLSKSHSNCTELTSMESGVKEVHIDEASSRTLGMPWHPTEDVFRFEFHPNKSYSQNTKRSILSLTSTLFDPIGVISPVM